MPYLFTVLFIALLVLADAQEDEQEVSRTQKQADAQKGKSIFDELDDKVPDFSHLSRDEELKAWKKLAEENVGLIPKGYIRFMERLEKEAVKPKKDSRYIGSWAETENNRLRFVFAVDGTFTNYGGSKGVGIWREHSEGIIWVGFAHTDKDDEGKERTYNTKHLFYLSDSNTLVQHHVDYTSTYKRIPSAGSDKPR